MNAAVISNGTIVDYERIKNILIKEYDFIICADGGAKHAYHMGIIPNLIVGDFDSLPNKILDYYSTQSVQIDTFPKKKDYTDSHLAIEIAVEKKAEKIGLFGCRGTRADHTLANVYLLFYIRKNKAAGVLIDDYNEIFLARSINTISGKPGDIISLLSLSPITTGVTLKGFSYPLDNANLYRDNPIGISNELVGEEGYVYKNEGDLLIIRSKD